MGTVCLMQKLRYNFHSKQGPRWVTKMTRFGSIAKYLPFSLRMLLNDYWKGHNVYAIKVLTTASLQQSYTKRVSTSSQCCVAVLPAIAVIDVWVPFLSAQKPWATSGHNRNSTALWVCVLHTPILSVCCDVDLSSTAMCEHSELQWFAASTVSLSGPLF